MNPALNRVVSEVPSDVKCERKPVSREDLNQEVAGERAFWKERKPSTEGFRRKFKMSRLADLRDNRGAIVLRELLLWWNLLDDVR